MANHAFSEFKVPEVEDIEHDSHSNSFEKYEQNFEKAKNKKDTSEKKKASRSFGVFRSNFFRMCMFLEKDGHKDWLVMLSKTYILKRTNCPECRNLYMTLANACSGKKVKVAAASKKKTAVPEEEVAAEGEVTPEPTATPPPNALNPSTELLDIISGVSREMAESKPREIGEEYFIAIQDLLIAMRSEQGKTTTAKLYFETLAEYIEAPFKARGYLNSESETQEEGHQPTPTPAVSLDDLF